jgi:DNA-directed RNA polymerase specialized sigma24 family protein
MNKADFVKLQKEWYGKLKAAGFRDIERTRDVDGQAFDCALFTDTRHLTPETATESEEYWHLCRTWMHHSATFRTLKPQEQAIWELYCEGVTYREIVKQVGRPLTSVHNVIQRLRTRALGERGTLAEDGDSDAEPDAAPRRPLDPEEAGGGKGRPWHTSRAS